MKYVALLRGINVGGNNIIKMTALKACFEKQGLDAVSTYIQSGNVLFDSKKGGALELCKRIEATLAKTFDYRASVVLVSERRMTEIVRRAPKGFGSEPAKYRYDVLFLKPPLIPSTALKIVKTRAGVDQAYAGNGVLYFSRLIAKATQSQLNKIAGTPIYKNLTIRNWNTTTALLRLLTESKA
jgi:uncharacterized protein (DUF1697 family)